MMNRTIHRRLHRLEARVLPASKKIVFLIEYVSPTGEVTETVEIGREPKPAQAAAPPRSRQSTAARPTRAE
jgi:hypothetical protein